MERLSAYGAFPVSSLPIQDNHYRVPLNGRFDIGYVYDLWYDGGTTLWFSGYGLGRFDTRTRIADLYLADGDARTRGESITTYSVCRDDSLFWLGSTVFIFLIPPGGGCRFFGMRRGSSPYRGLPAGVLSDRGDGSGQERRRGCTG
jgi:hypothetical protein